MAVETAAGAATAPAPNGDEVKREGPDTVVWKRGVAPPPNVAPVLLKREDPVAAPVDPNMPPPVPLPKSDPLEACVVNSDEDASPLLKSAPPVG